MNWQLNPKAQLRASLYPRGNDGISPEISVEQIQDGHAVTIRDITGQKQFSVMDGKDGKDGKDAQNAAPSVICQVTGQHIAVKDSASDLLRGLTLYGSTTQNGTPTPDAPAALVSPGDGGSIKVSVTGKNLITLPYRDGTSRTHNGITYTVNEDGSVYVDGEAVGGTSYFRFANVTEKFYEAVLDTGTNGIMTLSEEVRCGGGITYLNYKVGETANVNKTMYPQIEFGTVATAWEAPKQAQSVTVSTPGGLKGIGDVRDEIDLVRGVRIQRVGSITFDGTENWQNDSGYSNLFITGIVKSAHSYRGMCDQFVTATSWSSLTKTPFSIGVRGTGITINFGDSASDAEGAKAWIAEHRPTLFYILETPIETPLSDAELAAFSQLRTHKPNTSIFNDGDAEMEVSYAADTKTYIDNKFNELARAILNNA